MTYASVTSPAEFKQYVADLYERLGYTIDEVVAAKKLYKANKGIHVTNSCYYMSAMQFAAQNNIELVDGEMIEEYISVISQKK